MSSELITKATLRARRLYSPLIAQAVIDRLQGDWSLREQSDIFRVAAVLLAEEILAQVDPRDPDEVRRAVTRILASPPEGQPVAEAVADAVWSFSKRATPKPIYVDARDGMSTGDEFAGAVPNRSAARPPKTRHEVRPRPGEIFVPADPEPEPEPEPTDPVDMEPIDPRIQLPKTRG